MAAKALQDYTGEALEAESVRRVRHAPRDAEAIRNAIKVNAR